MEYKFDKLLESFPILEKQQTDVATDNGVPTPGTTVSIKPEALTHPFIKMKSLEFQQRMAEYVEDNKKKKKKFRLVVTNVIPARNSVEYYEGASAPLGYLVTVVNQIGPVSKGHFSVPLELLTIENAAWNAMQADIPDEWNYDTTKFGKFMDVINGYMATGNPPVGTLAAEKKTK